MASYIQSRASWKDLDNMTDAQAKLVSLHLLRAFFLCADTGTVYGRKGSNLFMWHHQQFRPVERCRRGLLEAMYYRWLPITPGEADALKEYYTLIEEASEPVDVGHAMWMKLLAVASNESRGKYGHWLRARRFPA